MESIRKILNNKRLMKYLAMAVVIVGIELVTFQAVYLASWNYYLATVVSFLVGVVLNWIVGRLFVFGKSKHSAPREFAMVFTASIVGVLIQVAVVFVSVQLLLLYPLVGKMLSIVFSFFWNYWFRAAVVYKTDAKAADKKPAHRTSNPIETTRKFIKRYPNKTYVALFIAVGLAASYAYFLRFPNNFVEPNFYAEDGSVYLHNIETHGFTQALFTTFNGYFIAGLYLLEGAGYALNALLFHGSFLDMPKSFAVVSYLFLGFVSTLPLLLFRQHAKLAALLLLVVFSVFVPMPGYDYAIIGTIGNLKFVFVYVAFLLLLYRHLLAESSWKRIVVVDAILLVCAYTNIVVYVLMPFALLRYWRYLRPDKKWLLELLRLRSFQSLLILGVLLLPQLAVIKLFGIPIIAGYLDTPYQWDATVNTFVYRTYLFPFLPGLTTHLNDIFALIAFVTFNVFLWFGLKSRRYVYAFGMISAFLITLLFVLNRTGVSELFKDYVGSGPDQFFYTQNLIACFMVAFATGYLIEKIPKRGIRVGVYVAIALCVVTLYIPEAGSYGKNDFMQRTVKNIYVNAQEECETNKGTPDIQLYPVQTDAFPLKDITRDRICTEQAASYVPDTEYYSFESQGGTMIEDVAPADIRQTFVANYEGLSGISVMFLTYKQSITDKYSLTLFESDCKTILRSVPIDSDRIEDTAYARIDFDHIEKSKGKTYCFTITETRQKTKALALALTKNDLYPEGSLKASNQVRADDSLFRLHYNQQ